MERTGDAGLVGTARRLLGSHARAETERRHVAGTLGHWPERLHRAGCHARHRRAVRQKPEGERRQGLRCVAHGADSWNVEGLVFGCRLGHGTFFRWIEFLLERGRIGERVAVLTDHIEDRLRALPRASENLDAKFLALLILDARDEVQIVGRRCGSGFAVHSFAAFGRASIETVPPLPSPGAGRVMMSRYMFIVNVCR